MADDWPRPVVHWAIETPDLDRARAFYAELFSWNISDGGIGFVDAGFGGPEPGPAGHLQSGATPRVSLYVQVRDLDETLGRTIELGGTVIDQPFQFPGNPTLATIADPDGNPITLVQQ